MNKVAINLLCILILGFLGASILIPGGGIGYYIFQGFDQEYTDVDPAADQYAPPEGSTIDAAPASFGTPPASLRTHIRFDDGRTYPVSITAVKIHAGETPEQPVNMVVVSGLAAVAVVVCYILMAIKFVKFVIHINRGEIFSRRNIRLLTWIGIFLLAIAVLETLIGLFDDAVLNSMKLRLEGVPFSAQWSMPYSEYLIGLLSLLMANIWRRGLHLKEEQELTI